MTTNFEGCLYQTDAYRATILILNYFEGVVAAESSSTVSSSRACVHRECFTMSVCAHESARMCV